MRRRPAETSFALVWFVVSGPFCERVFHVARASADECRQWITTAKVKRKYTVVPLRIIYLDGDWRIVSANPVRCIEPMDISAFKARHALPPKLLRPEIFNHGSGI